jgi:hypothetical protein
LHAILRAFDRRVALLDPPRRNDELVNGVSQPG